MASKELAQSLEKLAKEKGIKYTDKEAMEAADNLVAFFEVLIEIDREQSQKKKNHS